MSEVWRDVEGWLGFYQVSDAGNVRSVDRRWPVTNRFGNVEMRLHRGQVLKAPASKNGYPMVSFTRPGKVRAYLYVHHLVAQAFLGEKPDGMEICHRNGIRADCRASNLRYDTRSASALDRHVRGTMNQARGEKHYFSKLTAEDVRLIRQLRPATSARALAEKFGVHYSTIENAVNRKHWKHV